MQVKALCLDDKPGFSVTSVHSPESKNRRISFRHHRNQGLFQVENGDFFLLGWKAWLLSTIEVIAPEVSAATSTALHNPNRILDEITDSNSGIFYFSLQRKMRTQNEVSCMHFSRESEQ